MVKSLFITRPTYDETTSYLYAYAGKTINFAKDRSIKVIDFSGERANRKAVETFFEKHNPSIAFFNGHGTETSILGHNDELLISHENSDLLQNSVVYALACGCAESLGPKSVEKGAKAFIGYSDDFILFKDKSKTCKPLSDDIARAFLDPANSVPISLLSGKSPSESKNFAIKEFEKAISHLSSSAAPLNSEFALFGLFWNMHHLVCVE